MNREELLEKSQFKNHEEREELKKLSDLNGPVPKKYPEKINFDDHIYVQWVAYDGSSSNEVHITLGADEDKGYYLPINKQH